MIVTIPSRTEHAGIHVATYEISNNCPVCGGKRGQLYGVFSYDSSRRLHVDGWVKRGIYQIMEQSRGLLHMVSKGIDIFGLIEAGLAIEK